MIGMGRHQHTITGLHNNGRQAFPAPVSLLRKTQHGVHIADGYGVSHRMSAAVPHGCVKKGGKYIHPNRYCCDTGTNPVPSMSPSIFSFPDLSIAYCRKRSNHFAIIPEKKKGHPAGVLFCMGALIIVLTESRFGRCHSHPSNPVSCPGTSPAKESWWHLLRNLQIPECSLSEPGSPP